MSPEYLKVERKVVEDVGLDAAYLFAFLKLEHRSLRRGSDGYVWMEASYVERGIGYERNKFHYCRKKLVDAGLIDYISGNNQNAKPRYKVLK